ncbi:MAG: hypothetical protein ACI30H_02275 [Paludibacteraceae bacterium]
MANLKSGLILNEGENLVMELKAEMWASSQNPLAKLWGSIVKFFNFLLGRRRRGFVVITNQRVVEVIQKKALWVFNVGKDVKYLLPSSIKEVGYTKEGTCLGCCCQSYTLYYEAFTEKTSVLLQTGNENETQKVVDSFYKAILKAQTNE